MMKIRHYGGMNSGKKRKSLKNSNNIFSIRYIIYDIKFGPSFFSFQIIVPGPYFWTAKKIFDPRGKSRQVIIICKAKIYYTI